MTPTARKLVSTAYALLMFTGCARPPAAPVKSIGGPSGVITWLAVNKDNPVLGVDEATVCREGTTFIVWSDFDSGSSSSSSSSSDGLSCRGQMHARDGSKVEFRCTTQDGTTGPVMIGETKYDLANGNLFLVARDGERLRVKQLRRDFGNVEFTRESFEAYARKDAETLSFFTRSAKPTEKPARRKTSDHFRRTDLRPSQ